MRSYNSTLNFVQQVWSQIKKSKALILPAALRMFKGYGQMDCNVKLKGVFQVELDSHLRPKIESVAAAP